MDRPTLPKVPAGLPTRLRIQFAVTRRITPILRSLGLRDAVIRWSFALARARRGAFELCGSARYSRPALHGMDRKLDAIINRDGGVFVEAGGYNGYTQSNTYYLERFRGWRGILVEPMPELAAEARRNRPATPVHQCALVPLDHQGESVELHFGDLFTTVRGSRDDDLEWVQGGLMLGWRDHRCERVAARALSDLLDESGIDEVDLLSLDVEGFEEQALRGLDLTRHAPAWILVEMHDLDEGRAKIGTLLAGRYVEHELLSPLDVLYRRSD